MYEIHADEYSVEAWSKIRLPFEPRGVTADFRSDLRSALKNLTVPDRHLMRAVYAAYNTGELVDAENVLLYNVGSASFRVLARNGLRFERSYVVPPAPEGMEHADQLHHHHYSSVEPSAVFDHWSTGGVLAHIGELHIDRMNKPGPIWAAARTQLAPPSAVAAEPRPFAIRLVVRAPVLRSPATFVKPLLDGLIAAFHGHDGEVGDDLVERVAAGSDMSTDQARDALLDQRWAALGSRTLVRRFRRHGVQWNPADEYCVAAQVHFVRDATENSWQVSGDLAFADQTSIT